MEYREIAQIYESLFSGREDLLPPDDPPMRYLRRFLSEKRDQHILDAGCGSGRHSRTLAAEGYRRITAVDLFPKLETGGCFTYIPGNIEQLSLPDESVDLLFSMSVIYYLPDPSTAFREFFRVMKPAKRWSCQHTHGTRHIRCCAS